MTAATKAAGRSHLFDWLGAVVDLRADLVELQPRLGKVVEEVADVVANGRAGRAG
jgi:hypothetical protein